MATEVEIKFGGVANTHVYSGASGNVSTFSNFILFAAAEQASVVTFLYDDEGDTGLVTNF